MDVCILTGSSYSFISIQNTLFGEIFVESLPHQSAEQGGVRTAQKCGSDPLGMNSKLRADSE